MTLQTSNTALVAWEAITVSDGTSKCICCLGRLHIPWDYNFCLAIKSRDSKNWEIKLRLLMMERPFMLLQSQVAEPPHTSVCGQI